MTPTNLPSSNADRLPQADHRWQNLLFVLLWVLANTLPWAVLWVPYRTFSFLPGPVVWCLLCALIGIAQWLLLRQRIASLRWWPIATLIGAGIGSLGFLTFIFAMFVAPMTMGIGVGVAQWTLLRNKFTNAFWWIAGTTGGALIGLVLSYIVFSSGSGIYSSDLEALIFKMVGVIEVSSSLVTGNVMLTLLKQNAAQKLALEQGLESGDRAE